MAKDDQKTDEIVDEETKNDEIKMPQETTEDMPDEAAEKSLKPENPKRPNIFKRLWAKYTSKKKIAIPLTLLVLAAVLYAIPLTRYALAGLVIKKDFSVMVIDSLTSMPVSGVEVNLSGKTAKTDGEGKAILGDVKVGKSEFKASKKHYKDSVATVTVLLGTVKDAYQVKLEATGRQIPIVVNNKLTGKSLASASVKVADSETQTDKEGKATLVLPANSTTEKGTVTADGYNELPVEIKVSELAVKENTFALTPVGKVYLLSKKTGKIDVVKTDLDGGNRQTVLAGTGQEEDTSTVLLASRDWKFLALQSRRESDKARLYLIDTSNDQLTEIDSGDASFTLAGWHDHNFAYTVYRNNVLNWQPKRSAIKTYNADNKQLSVIDETNAEGNGDSDYASEVLGSVYILKDGLIYTKHWYASYYSVYRLAGKRMGIYKVKPNGTDKQLLKDFDVGNSGYISASAYEPEEVYFAVYNSATNYYEYHDGKVVDAKDVTADSFNKFYPTYLLSPNGQSTFWYEPRDGKNTLFTGNQTGENGKEIATLSEYIPYGWYGDDYLLVSKDGSELYILPAKDPVNKEQILKITDYHKPATSFAGYGYGYGGQ